MNTIPADRDFKFIVPMFPYPSGTLHMGHVRNYILSDVLSSYFKSKGENVIHPIGFDAFGLPAENAAIKNGTSAASWTSDNIKKMEGQLKDLNIEFDYDAKLSTCDKDFYHFTQEFFKKCFDEKYIYTDYTWVNYDPVEKTILSNEQVIDGRGWRSNAIIEKKQIKAYFFDMKRWAKKLNDNIEELNWPEKVKKMQKNWINYKTGFSVEVNKHSIFIFDKDPTIIAIGPFSKMAQDFYQKNIDLRVWFESEVLKGSVSRKEVFKKQTINTETAVSFYYNEKHYSCPVIIDPSLDAEMVAIQKEYLSTAINANVMNGFVKPDVFVGLRDWCLNRQRYWGTPIPIVHCQDCGDVSVDKVDLPIIEKQESFNALKNADFENCTCPKCGKNAKKETDTLDTFFDSSWYFHHYISKKFQEKTMVSQNAKPVDWYVGGAEHANMHLIYARVFNYVLKEMKMINFEEPILNLMNQGMVLKDGEKMSKSKGNIVNPMEYIEKYGSDTVRMFMIFAAPPSESFDFKPDGMVGIYRFLNQVCHFGNNEIKNVVIEYNAEVFPEMNKKFKELNNFIDNEFSKRKNLNVIIPQFMIFFKALKKSSIKMSVTEREEVFNQFMNSMKPFAPNICNDLLLIYKKKNQPV